MRAISPGALWWVLKHALIGWWNDNVPRLGASLAYYTLFALAPILIVAIAVAGLAFGPEAVRILADGPKPSWKPGKQPAAQPVQGQREC